MVRVEEMRPSWAAKVPTPCTRSMSPSACSSRSARLTVIRLTPKLATSSASDGISWPGRQRPEASPAFRLSLTREYGAAARGAAESMAGCYLHRPV